MHSRAAGSSFVAYASQRFLTHRRRAGSGDLIAFRPDGRIGVVAQDDGTLGVFWLDDQGQPTVVHARYEGGFFAHRAVFDPVDPDLIYVLDNQFPENGGGIYAVRLACDGTVSSEQKILEAKLPSAIAFDGDDCALLAAEQVASGTPNTIVSEPQASGLRRQTSGAESSGESTRPS